MDFLPWLVLAAPAVGFLTISFGTRPWPRLSGLVTVFAVLVSFIASLPLAAAVLGGRPFQASFPWLSLGPGSVLPLGLQVDSLTAVMLIVVTSVSFLVQVYSQGYMHDDPGYSRYFAFMALFTMSMLGLVLADNFLALYIFWEGVGLCSYLLIGFWHQRPEAAAAAKKAFIVTRIGDFGFLLGILYLFREAGTLQFSAIEAMIRSGRLGPDVLTVAALLIFCGAVGKSAQFPLHVWLPDAMEGPTPVSALIHAATMVAAGVYLVARAFPIFAGSPGAMSTVATIGGFTAAFAATMGLVSNDMKRVMAYSTVSQLGYMMLALGVGARTAAMFHLFNHAFFKALLFLTAGSVIHSAHTQDLREMGGLFKAMRITGVTMAIGALSLAGVFPFSGFWSKDEILAATAEHNGALFVLALLTVFMTAFYAFRMFFMAFAGSPKGHSAPHESPPVMTVPLILLAIPSILTGLLGTPLMDHFFSRFLEGHAVLEETNWMAIVSSTVLAVVGIAMAWALYGAHMAAPDRLVQAARPLGPWLYQVFYHKYGMDELYNWFTQKVVVGLADLLSFLDMAIVDRIVNEVGRASLGAGSLLRRAQTGQVQTYVWVVFLGLVVIAIALVIPAIGRI